MEGDPMGDEINGDKKGRLDRIEELVHVLMNGHIEFHEEHRELLKAQVLLNDAQRKTEEKLAQLAVLHQDLTVAQRNADERMAALVITVDDIIRHRPQK